MLTRIKKHLTKPAQFTLLSSMLALGGCALPGMHMNINDLTPTPNAKGEVVTPTVTPITAELIQQQNKQAAIASALIEKNYHTPNGFSTNPNDYTYKIGRQDVLQITVWNAASLNTQMISAAGTATDATSSATANMPSQAGQLLTVDSEGNIFYPYVGEIHIAGLTLKQARNVLTQKLAAYIKNPQVSLAIASFHSQYVEVTGAVKQSAIIPITNVPLSVLSAITEAGGPIICGATTSLGSEGSQNLCADLQHVTIKRGKQLITVNLNNLSTPTGASANWILQNGDVVHVPNNNLYRIFVLGSVMAPGAYNMVDGQMSLKEAIGDAHGITVGANPQFTYVIRNYEHNPAIYSLNMQSPDALSLAGDFELKPEDVVFISTSAIQTFNDLLGQITPTLQTAVYTKSLFH